MDFFEAAEGPEPQFTSGINFEEELNEEQYAAVTAPFGPSLVLAGAGSGKTRTLTYRVAWLLDQGVDPSAILLLTFTNKAAREMLDRVADLTGVSSKLFWGGTFHHIGQRLLRRFGGPVGVNPGFNILDQSDSESLLSDVIRRVDPKFLKDKNNPKPKVIANLISYARNTLEDVGVMARERYPYPANLGPDIGRFAAAYEKEKRKQDVADYDDLLELWLKLLKTDPSFLHYCTQKFDQVLVDEYQDTNRLQAAIVDTIGSHHRVMAVGDDSQCIYTWRGAELNNIMTFPDRHPGGNIFKIETNYRSTPQILSFANSVLDGHTGGGFRKELRAVRPDGNKPILVSTVDTTQQAEFVIRTISQMVDNGRSYGDIVILYRAHFQAMDLQMELSRTGIPFQITSGVRFFEQAHVKDIVAQIRFVANPRDITAFLRFAGLLPKVGPRTAEKLYAFIVDFAEKNQQNFFDVLGAKAVVAKVPAPARDDWESLATTLRDCYHAAHDESPDEVVRLAVEGWYGTYLRTLYPNWKSREEDLTGVVGFASRFEELSELLAQLILLNSEASDRSIEPGEETIRLTTIHQSKGLEFPVVFILGLADGMFPLNRAVEEGNLDEETRLFYVSVTRAQDELFLSYPMVQSQGGPPRRLQPSRFLSSVRPDYYEAVRYRSSW
ncbi:ATP-dependent helicase [Puniceicoccus vermicola]|uniref:DNA 3'-5' helicase n=1 Tax=Puniceicoccus vermicola TaxID=388746 RepID=A0A7X1AUB2_9BACT|nr:ATP-dependent helicase [Puniceicoccus vermicola]MBC2600158.1 ATP-dependent helicase [Puniceicoccus vermicola]